MDAVWGEPVTELTLRVQLSRLRKLLKAAGSDVQSRGRSWSLDLGPSATDRDLYLGLHREASEASDPHEVVALSGDALALWRGRAFEDVADLYWAEGEAARLELMRT